MVIKCIAFDDCLMDLLVLIVGNYKAMKADVLGQIF